MQLTERHLINNQHPNWLEIDNLSFLAKNLYNAANYLVRQHFFATNKILPLPILYHQIKSGADYQAFPAKRIPDSILRKLLKNWKAYKEAHKAWQKNPEKFLSEPKIPKYKPKSNGRSIVIYREQAISKIALDSGICHLSQSNIKIKTQATKHNICEARIIPRNNHYIIEIVYKVPDKELLPANGLVAGIDLGLNNLVALTSNKPGLQPILINGRPLKSYNQFFNKVQASLQSKLPENQDWSIKLAYLNHHRNMFVENYLHQVSRIIVNWLIKNQITKLVIGHNPNWKQKINLGKRTNQNFVQIPHSKLINKIEYKCQLVGIEVIKTEESYTSKTSFLDGELPIKQKKYLGKRRCRGLFRASSGLEINADINGSLQIIRKVFPEAFVNGIESIGVMPLMVNPLKRSSYTNLYN